MKRLVLPAALLALAAPAGAAVSGYYDTANQIGAIFASAEVADALRQQPLREIEFEGISADGLRVWELSTRDCEVDVFLREIAAQGVGAATYEVARLGEVDCD